MDFENNEGDENKYSKYDKKRMRKEQEKKIEKSSAHGIPSQPVSIQTPKLMFHAFGARNDR
jgi:hypothetical protein